MNAIPLSRRALQFARPILVLVMFLAACQSKLIYHPRSYVEAEVSQSKAQPLHYTTEDGEQVAWLLHYRPGPDQKLPPRVWLVFGGNASCGLDYAAVFTDAALASDLFVLCDFPGYGHCAGHPSPQSIRRSTQAVVPAVAAKLGVSVEQLRPHLRGFGHSLGCAAVLMAMHDHHISSGVLVAPFTRMVDMAKRMLGWPLCEVLHHRFDNIAELRAIEAQDGTHLSLIHGTEDEVIPVSMSRALQKTFPSLITLHEAQGADHNSILDTHNDDIVAMMLKL